MTTESPTELDALTGDGSSTLTLSTGQVVRLEEFRTRHMLRLIKVFTRGAGPLLADLNFKGSQEAFTGQLLGTLLFAIPEAEDETIEFISSLVVPADAPVLTRRSSNAEREEYAEKVNEFLDNLTEDPPLADTIAILSKVIKAEAGNIKSLGNQIGALLPTAVRAEKSATPKKSRGATSKDASKN